MNQPSRKFNRPSFSEFLGKLPEELRRAAHVSTARTHTSLSTLPELGQFPSGPPEPTPDPLLYRVPGATWKLTPTRSEVKEIKRLDGCVKEAEEFYQANFNKTFPFRGCKEEINPTQYMDFLAHVYTSYEEQNALVDIHRGNRLHHNSPVEGYPKQASVPLAVIPYFKSPHNGNVPWGLPGQRCDFDHTPGKFVVKNSISHHGMAVPEWLNAATVARALPYRLHAEFHKKNPRLPEDPYESACMQMGWYHERLGELGHSEHAVITSEEQVHAMNRHLGIYDELGTSGLSNPKSRIYQPDPWGKSGR